MSIMIGGKDPAAIKVGTQDVKAVYAGTEKVWPDVVAQEPIRLLDFSCEGDGMTPVQISASETSSIMSLIAGKQPQYGQWQGSFNEPYIRIADLGTGMSGNDMLGVVAVNDQSQPAGNGGYDYSNNEDSACCLLAFEDCYFIQEWGQDIGNVAPDEILITIESAMSQFPPNQISITDGILNPVVSQTWTSGRGGGATPWQFDVNYVSNVTSGSTSISLGGWGWAIIRATRNRSLYLKHLAEKKVREKLTLTGTQEVPDV